MSSKEYEEFKEIIESRQGPRHKLRSLIHAVNSSEWIYLSLEEREVVQKELTRLREKEEV